MKSCAYCGRENPDDAQRCRECGGVDFSVPEPRTVLVQETVDGATEPVDPECDVPPDGEAALCTSCLFPNLQDSRWCKKCGAPLSSTIMLVMPDAAWGYGFALRRAVTEPPKLVVVLGIWLHFFPGFLISALVLLLTFVGGGEEGILGLYGVLLPIISGFACGSMLYRVTRNYFTMQRRLSIETAA